MIIKWPTRRAVHVNVANYDYDRTKGPIGPNLEKVVPPSTAQMVRKELKRIP